VIGPVLLFALGIAWIGGWLPSSKKPIFFREDGLRQLSCYGGSLDGVTTPIWVEFQNQGRMAVLRTGQTEARLPFTPTSGLDDIYANETIRFWLDPEIFVTGLGPHRVGPCELE
jgi:hypothetical protein